MPMHTLSTKELESRFRNFVLRARALLANNRIVTESERLQITRARIAALIERAPNIKQQDADVASGAEGALNGWVM